MGMKGVEVDFDMLEVGQTPSCVQVKQNRNNRVNLRAAPLESKAKLLPVGEETPAEAPGESVSLDIGEGQDFEAINYNHKTRRKLRRALEAAEIAKEMVVRKAALEYCQENDIEPPEELKT